MHHDDAIRSRLVQARKGAAVKAAPAAFASSQSPFDHMAQQLLSG